jgi:hypothetical protein
MPHSDRFERHYMIVDVPGDSTSLNVARLLEQTAERVRQHGQILVHHMVFETDPDGHDPSMSLVLYYDRIGEPRRP